MELASSAVRIRAGRDGGRLAASGRAFDEALSGFASAVRLMEEATWTGMGRTDQQRLLGELNGLPMDAAATAIELGRTGEAVEFLEQGRGVLLARQIEAPGLLALLRTRVPDLAEQLAWVQNALDQAEPGDTGLIDNDPINPPTRDLVARRSTLIRERTKIMDQIRAQPGLQDLVAPPRLDALLTASASGPVVIVNVSEYRCDALILAANQVRSVPLPSLTKQSVAEQVEKLLDAADTASRREIDEILKWAWDSIVEPVLTDLGLTEPAQPGQEPRIWWCATGLTTFVPLHAAGNYQDKEPAPCGALDLAVSSYTPTLRSLIQLRQRQPAPADGSSGPLIVAMPETPGLPDLESTREEAADLAQRFPVHEMLIGSSATCDVVAQAMPQHRWAHYACHGSQDLREPDRGSLHLYDGPLTIPQIMLLQLPNPAFAYLSACDTSRGGTTIPDEGITFASALQVAGYQHVIATLWQITGLTALDIAKRLYDQIVTERDGNIEIDTDGIAAALRTAIISIHNESPELPAMYWAPYIHTGP